MLIADTAAGVARVHEEHYEVVDTNGARLAELIRDDRLDLVRAAKTIGEVGLREVRTFAPISDPGKFCIVGLNYSDHAAEVGMELPKAVRFNYVPGSAVSGPFDDIRLPPIAPAEVDYEGELAIVIGRKAYRVPREKAWDYVAGVTVADDVSARDIQHGRGGNQAGANVGLGKGFDSFKPIGPALLTADELGPHEALRVSTYVDNEMRQDSSTANLVFGLTELVSTISDYGTLHPGDVILTGTPGGVAAGTGAFLREGQVVRVRVERVGELCNRVVAAT